MKNNKKQPKPQVYVHTQNIRMCIVCRKKYYKLKLLVFKKINNYLVAWDLLSELDKHRYRSYYLCSNHDKQNLVFPKQFKIRSDSLEKARLFQKKSSLD